MSASRVAERVGAGVSRGVPASAESSSGLLDRRGGADVALERTADKQAAGRSELRWRKVTQVRRIPATLMLMLMSALTPSGAKRCLARTNASPARPG